MIHLTGKTGHDQPGLLMTVLLDSKLTDMKKKVVLIQDNEHILEIMDKVLEDEGFEVTPSLTTEPIEKIEKIDPDVIVVDEHIQGDKKGTEVIEDLKSDPDTEELPAVLTSTSMDLPKKADQCKADDYIQKPFDLDHMVDVVKKNS
jgi:two-component system response regulator VicR